MADQISLPPDPWYKRWHARIAGFAALLGLLVVIITNAEKLFIILDPVIPAKIARNIPYTTLYKREHALDNILWNNYATIDQIKLLFGDPVASNYVENEGKKSYIYSFDGPMGQFSVIYIGNKIASWTYGADEFAFPVDEILNDFKFDRTMSLETITGYQPERQAMIFEGSRDERFTAVAFADGRPSNKIQYIAWYIFRPMLLCPGNADFTLARLGEMNCKNKKSTGVLQVVTKIYDMPDADIAVYRSIDEAFKKSSIAVKDFDNVDTNVLQKRLIIAKRQQSN